MNTTMNTERSVRDRTESLATLAIAAGIRATEHDTLRYGRVYQFAGERTFEAEGDTWIAVGDPGRGNATVIGQRSTLIMTNQRTNEQLIWPGSQWWQYSF